MKNFNEFLNENTEKIVENYKKNLVKSIKEGMLNITEEQLEYVQSVSSQILVAFLGSYHYWLIDQLNEENKI